MKLLGIDWGEAKIGLALGEGFLAEPYGIIPQNKWHAEILRICHDIGVEKIVLGLSEGKSAEKTKKFAIELEKVTHLPVIFEDETLSTQYAQKIVRAKKVNEDAVAAALILQSYLDKNPQTQ